MQINLSQVTYSYEDAPDNALAPVSATFAQGWTGIVGVNGSGKSTLLRLVCGELTPCSGQINPKVNGVYCAQETELKPEGAEDFVLDYSGEALRVKRLLAIDDSWVWRYESLSEGERKRLQIAVALWQEPSILALDEPTNHVDALCREKLAQALARYKGVGLLVSHDRALLDELTSNCLFLGSGGATMRPGNYSQGHEQEQLERASTAHERAQAKAELSRLRQVKAARSNEAAQADARRSKRKIAKGDKDAKARIDLAIYSGQDGKAGKRSVQMDAQMAAAEKRLSQAQVEKVYNADVWLDTTASKRRVLLELSEGFIPFDAKQDKGASGAQEKAAVSIEQRTTDCPGLLIPSLAIGPSDHIALSGPNGTGKSTLVRKIMQQISPDLRTSYLPQEFCISERKTKLQELNSLPAEQRGRVLSIVAQLNSDPDRLLSGELASPGETRKLMLALDILSKPEIIIMDEPTNHLDLISIEALERLLAACPCALLLVSHDEQFLAKTTNLQWSISPSAGECSTLQVR